MSSAIAKVKDIMAEFNLTIEHLTQTVAGKGATKKTKAKTASVAKYADPKTGKTWSGFGRAPGWIAGAKNRDAFLVGASSPAAVAAAKEPAAAKTASAKPAKAVKVAKKAAKGAAKKPVATAKKAPNAEAAPVAAKKKPAAKKVVAKKSAPKRVAAASVEPTAMPTAQRAGSRFDLARTRFGSVEGLMSATTSHSPTSALRCPAALEWM